MHECWGVRLLDQQTQNYLYCLLLTDRRQRGWQIRHGRLFAKDRVPAPASQNPQLYIFTMPGPGLSQTMQRQANYL